MQTNSQVRSGYRESLKLTGSEFAFLDQILGDSPDLITIHDASNNQIIYCNHYNFWKDLFDPEEVYKMKDEERVAAMVYDDDMEKAKAFLQQRRLLQDGKSAIIELR